MNRLADVEMDMLGGEYVLTLYITKGDVENFWGDDWDDVPYEHNAGTVYDQFVDSKMLLYLNTYNYNVLRASYGYSSSSPYSKNMLRDEDITYMTVYNKRNPEIKLPLSLGEVVDDKFLDKVNNFITTSNDLLPDHVKDVIMLRKYQLKIYQTYLNRKRVW